MTRFFLQKRSEFPVVTGCREIPFGRIQVIARGCRQRILNRGVSQALSSNKMRSFNSHIGQPRVLRRLGTLCAYECRPFRHIQ